MTYFEKIHLEITNTWFRIQIRKMLWMIACDWICIHVRGTNLIFKYFNFLFGPGLLYPLRVLAKLQKKILKHSGHPKELK